MADKDNKIDPFDVAALEKSVNDSAGRVSTIWISFVLFGAYLAAAASNITHRQLFLEDVIKLPTINIDLPLFASALLLPILFVVYHGYVLLQVLLLARTAATYGDAIERTNLATDDQARLRQRLPNTLFAQIFAGSSREQSGVVGALLQAMMWITLAVGPILVLLVFEVKCLPYHNSFVTWSHRILLVLDLLVVFLLWAGAVDARRDIDWGMVKRNRFMFGGGAIFALLWWFLVDFPGEVHSNWIRKATAGIGDGRYEGVECHSPAGHIFAERYDRIVLIGESFVETKASSSEYWELHEAQRRDGAIPSLEGRDFRCAIFIDVKLGSVMLADAHLERATFIGVDVRGSVFRNAGLQGAAFFDVQMDELNFNGANLQDTRFMKASMRGTRLIAAQLQGADLSGATLNGAVLENAKLHGALIDKASLQGANLSGAQLQAVNLRGSNLGGAILARTQLQGGDLRGVDLQGAYLSGAGLEGSNLTEAQFQGAIFSTPRRDTTDQAYLKLSLVDRANVWRAAGADCKDAYVTGINHRPVLPIISSAGITESRDATSAVIDEFAEQAVQKLPSNKQSALQERLRQMLSRSDEASERIKKVWDECAEHLAQQPDQREARRKYELALAEYLIELACDVGSDEPHVISGIYRWWTDAGPLGDAARQRLAAGLLGANTKKKTCTDRLTKTMRESLSRIAAGQKKEAPPKENEDAEN